MFDLTSQLCIRLFFYCCFSKEEEEEAEEKGEKEKKNESMEIGSPKAGSSKDVDQVHLKQTKDYADETASLAAHLYKLLFHSKLKFILVPRFLVYIY